MNVQLRCGRLGGAKALRRPQREERGGVILWRPPAYSLLLIQNRERPKCRGKNLEILQIRKPDEDENTRTPKLTVVITMALSLTRQHAVIYGDVVWGLAFAQYSWPNYVALTIINADKTRRNRNPVAVTAVTRHPINQPW